MPVAMRLDEMSQEPGKKKRGGATTTHERGKKVPKHPPKGIKEKPTLPLAHVKARGKSHAVATPNKKLAGPNAKREAYARKKA